MEMHVDLICLAPAIFRVSLLKGGHRPVARRACTKVNHEIADDPFSSRTRHIARFRDSGRRTVPIRGERSDLVDARPPAPPPTSKDRTKPRARSIRPARSIVIVLRSTEPAPGRDQDRPIRRNPSPVGERKCGPVSVESRAGCTVGVCPQVCRHRDPGASDGPRRDVPKWTSAAFSPVWSPSLDKRAQLVSFSPGHRSPLQPRNLSGESDVRGRLQRVSGTECSNPRVASPFARSRRPWTPPRQERWRTSNLRSVVAR